MTAFHLYTAEKRPGGRSAVAGKVRRPAESYVQFAVPIGADLPFGHLYLALALRGVLSKCVFCQVGAAIDAEYS
jgi:hypothetical protein